MASTIDDVSKSPSHISLAVNPLVDLFTQANQLVSAPSPPSLNHTSITADTGYTGYYLMPDAPISNLQPAIPPIQVLLPNGGTISSSHTTLLHLPGLPANARHCNIFPNLASSSLPSLHQPPMQPQLYHHPPQMSCQCSPSQCSAIHWPMLTSQ